MTGWLGDPDRQYPAEPWDLHGRAFAGVWLLPKRLAPPPHSSRTPAVRVFGRCIVGAAFFVYEEPSPLTYDEVMATVLVRDGWRPRVSITHIWVNSPASRDGGRDLWAIPKELAEFTTSATAYDAHGIAVLSTGTPRTVRVPVGLRLAQGRDGTALTSPVRGRVGLGITRGRWAFAADGPLAFLAGRTPLLTLAMAPFHLMFGHRAR